MTDRHGNQRMARADFWQLLLAFASIVLIPTIGLGVSVLVRLAVVEVKVEDLRKTNGLAHVPSDSHPARQISDDET